MSFIVEEPKPDHHYRIEIPNLIDELELDVYEFRLYSKLKRVAGDSGTCFQSIKTLADGTKISERKVQQCLDSLSKGKNKLGIKLIKINYRKKSDGSNDTSLITIIDIWRVNGDHFRSKIISTGAQDAPPLPHVMHPPGAPHADKQEPSEEEPVFVCSEHSSPQKDQISKVKLTHPDGHIYEVLLSDIFTFAVRSKMKWTTDQINKAWEVIINYKKVIRCPFRFIAGTIDNIINQENANKLNEKLGKNKWNKKKNQSTSNLKNKENLNQESENIKEESLDKGTSMPAYQELISALLRKKKCTTS